MQNPSNWSSRHIIGHFRLFSSWWGLNTVSAGQRTQNFKMYEQGVEWNGFRYVCDAVNACVPLLSLWCWENCLPGPDSILFNTLNVWSLSTVYMIMFNLCICSNVHSSFLLFNYRSACGLRFNFRYIFPVEGYSNIMWVFLPRQCRF